jgi:hypothetical protein
MAKQRWSSSAHGRYRAPERFAGFSASAVPSDATTGLGTIFGRSLLAGDQRQLDLPVDDNYFCRLTATRTACD